MKHFSPQELFDLSHFQHSLIFDECENVWEVLPKIEKFLRSLTLGVIQVGIPTGAHLIQPDLISIGKGSVIEPGAYIRGPCIIGENCTIRQGSYIRGQVIVGNHCVIGHDTEMKNVLMLDKAQAAHFAYLGDSIIGNCVVLGAGAKCANLRLDHREVTVHFNKQKFSTGLKKFGAILGDYTQLGCNSVTNPGTITGKHVHCYPCMNFGGYIPPHSLIEPSALPKIRTNSLS